MRDITLLGQDESAFEFRTSGGDPFIYTTPLPDGTGLSANHVLAFEYFSPTGTGEIQVFLSPREKESASVRGGGLSRSEVWSVYSIDLKPALSKSEENITRLRIDFGGQGRSPAVLGG